MDRTRAGARSGIRGGQGWCREQSWAQIRGWDQSGTGPGLGTELGTEPGSGPEWDRARAGDRSGVGDRAGDRSGVGDRTGFGLRCRAGAAARGAVLFSALAVKIWRKPFRIERHLFFPVSPAMFVRQGRNCRCFAGEVTQMQEAFGTQQQQH